MIVPMKKITLLVLKNEQRKALKDLRKLGLVHIEDRPASGTLITELRNEKNDLMLAKSLLLEYLPSKKVKNSTEPSILSEEDTLKFIYSVLDLTSSHKSHVEEAGKLKAELAYYSNWGDFSSLDFKELAEKGIYLFPFSSSEKAYKCIPETIKTVFLSNVKKTVHFLVWSESNSVPGGLPADCIPLKMPEESIKTIRERLKTLNAKITSYKTEMAKMSAYLNSIEALDKIVSKKLEFEIVHDGMPVIPLNLNKDLSDECSQEDYSEKNLQLVLLTGYVPAEQEKLVSNLAKEKSWAYISEDPKENDAVPTKLKHNKIVSLITPLTDFLGTLPGYTEPDISLWFLLFFGIFFAMIFGDAGYGSVLVLISAFLMIKTKVSGKKIPAALMMFAYLGVMTIVWGTLVCNWFGIPAEKIPQSLKNLAVPAIANFTEENVRNQNQILLCFTIGVIQLLIAHVIGFFRNIKSPKFIGELGSILMLCGMYFVVLNLVVDAEKYTVNNYVLSAVGIGFLLNFLFVNYSDGLGGAILESFKNIINMFLGVVNVFADIMSYIRLWAVGLAGSAISATVNEMAGPMLGGFIIFAGILLLLFGHGLNYIMNVLSVIVHGVRLNTLEFSNHVGLTWSGFKYEPFNE